MASIQDKLEQGSLKIRQILFDNTIDLTGKMTQAIRLKVEKNQYGDSESEIVTKDKVDCVIVYPGNVPLNRNRTSQFVEEASTPHLFLMDILPIDLYTKWTDNVERNDFIIDQIKDEHGYATYFILQVSEVVGQFRSNLLWKKSQCAPYNGPISREVQFALDTLDLPVL